jgi:hypothetical protein
LAGDSGLSGQSLATVEKYFHLDPLRLEHLTARYIAIKKKAAMQSVLRKRLWTENILDYFIKYEYKI